MGQLAAWEQCRPRERVSHAEDPGVWGLRPRARGSEVASRARERAEEACGMREDRGQGRAKFKNGLI